MKLVHSYVYERLENYLLTWKGFAIDVDLSTPQLLRNLTAYFKLG